MPPYDPKANRPKLVPVDEPAPVDALLAPPADEPVAPAPAPAPRPHLSVVADPTPTVDAAPPADPAAVTPLRTGAIVAAAVLIVVVVGAVVAARRRS